MLICVLTIFVLSWLPDIIVQIIRMTDYTVIPANNITSVALLTITFTFLNNAVNPFLYMVMSG